MSRGCIELRREEGGLPPRWHYTFDSLALCDRKEPLPPGFYHHQAKLWPKMPVCPQCMANLNAILKRQAAGNYMGASATIEKDDAQVPEPGWNG